MSRQILIVEDELFLLRTLTRALSSLTEYEVAGVDSVQQAREVLETLRPDLVVCDLALGDGSGLEVIELIRKHGLSVPVVILSGVVEEFTDIIPTGPNIVVRSKPLPARDLVQLVESRLALENPSRAEGVFSLSDYLQMAQLGRRSMRIDLRHEGGAKGTINIWQGEPWSARLGRKQGSDAMVAMLAHVPISLVTATLLECPEREIDTPMHVLLLEQARLSDERKHAGEPEESLDTEPPQEEDVMLSILDGAARGDLPSVAQRVRAARDARPSDARLHAWWCDLLDQQFPARGEIRNGGAA